MHILYVTTEFITDHMNAGGLANYLANMSNIFKEHGHKVTVLVVAAIDKRCFWNSIEVIYYNASRSLEWLATQDKLKAFYLLRSIYINRNIQAINRKNKIDIVQLCANGVIAYNIKISIPWIIRLSSFPGLCEIAEKEKKSFKIEQALNRIDERSKIQLESIQACPFIISPSNLCKELVEKNLKRRVYVIESPYCDYNEKTDECIYNQKLYGKKYFLYFGHLCRLKGIHTLANSAECLLEKYPEHNLVLVGINSKIEDYKNIRIDADKYVKKKAGKYKDRVIYIKGIPKSQLVPIIKNAEMCIFPSRIDNLPNACIEALGLGKAVVGTRRASYDQLIVDGMNGFLCEIDSPITLMQCIDRYMELDEYSKSLIHANARKRVNLMLPDKIYEKYLRTYKIQIQKQKIIN